MGGNKKIRYAIAIIVLLAAITSVFYITNNKKEPVANSPESISEGYYNDFLVQKSNLGYITKLYIGDSGPYHIETKYHPKDVENISIDFNIRGAIIKGKEHIYVAIDPFDTRLTGPTTIAAMELKAMIEPFFKVPVNSAFTKEKGDYLVKGCPEQNKTEAVILLSLGKETRIFKNDNCIILEATDQEILIKEADAVVFKLLTITK